MVGSPFIRKLLRDDRGATAIEYGLIAAMISLAAMMAMGEVAGEQNESFTTVSVKLDAANDTVPPLAD